MKTKDKSPLCVLLSGLTGILLFLVLLLVFGYVASFFHNAVLLGIVSLLVNNITLVISAGIVLIIADIFYTLRFPYNLPAPVIGALGNIMVVGILFLLLDYFDSMYELGIADLFREMKPFIYLLVFFIVVIAGYIRIFSPEQPGCGESGGDGACSRGCNPENSCNEAANNFREEVCGFFQRMREEINRK